MKGSCNLEEDLFAAALALPVIERERYLGVACDNDEALHARLNTLLGAVTAGSALLAQTPVGGSLESGEEIGAYRIVQEIGEGGCAVVYLAQQTVPVRREVALKVVKLGMDTRALIARFAAERQALALMDHPHIAKVFDAGATPAGRPFFAMELVRGIRITDYCNQTRLPVADRLSLLMQVCQAVQHAHQQGVVHRDIKPSNVLVTLCDGMPIVKVIDFGIAKAVQGRLTDQTLFTALEQFVGTPAYVSPEQTVPGSPHADARSDIYSLGVLLYELLTGATPFDITGGPGRVAQSLRERICATEPVRPSKHLGSLPKQQLENASLRYRTGGARWIKQVRGDLDYIVMRCLEKDQARRYQTATHLWLDLQRYQRDEPVVARPHRVAYTFAKFARRHRMVFATGATIIAVLAIATTVTTWLALRASQARQVAQEITTFLQDDLLAQASPIHEPDRDLKLRTVLDRAAAKIQGRFAGRPRVEASVRETLGQTYQSLGEYSHSQTQFERVLGIYRQELGESDPRTLAVMNTLVRLLTRQAKYQEADVLGREALRLHKQALGPAHPGTLLISASLAGLYMSEGKYAEGERLLAPALELQVQRAGVEHPDTLDFMSTLAAIYVGQSKYVEAEALLSRELAGRRRLSGAMHPDTVAAVQNLGTIYLLVGESAKAEGLLREALAAERGILGAEHPKTLDAMTSLAQVYWQLGRFAEEEQLEAEVVEVSRRARGPQHHDTLLAMNNLAKTYLEHGKLLPVAAALEIQALNGAQQLLGPEHRTTIAFKLNLALIYVRLGKLTEAAALLAEGVRSAKRVLGPDDHYTVEYLDALGAVLITQGRFGEAESALREALRGLREYSVKNWWVVDAPHQYEWQKFSTQSRLGEALVGLKRFGEAEALLLAGYEGLRQRSGSVLAKYKPDLHDADARLRQLYRRWGKTEKLEEWQRKCRGQHAECSGEQPGSPA